MRTATTATTATKPEQALEIGETYTGTCVAWHDKGWGFGFLRVAGFKDIFVVARDITNFIRLERGARVQFDVAMDNTGRLKATNATLIE